MPVTQAIRIQGHSSGGELLDKANLYFKIISIYLTSPSVPSEASKNVSTTFYNSDCRSFVVAFEMKR